MNTQKLLKSLLLAFCILNLVSCGNDDAILFPEGTSSLRMMNEDNGKNLLGNSDVYITNSGNFHSSQSPIFDMGRKEGISDIEMPDFVNMAPEVAVEPGHGYVVCNADDVMSFPSGQLAIATSAYVYRIFVDSWITENNANVGANVRFLRGEASQGVLPEYGSSIGSVILDPYVDIDKQPSTTLKLPGKGKDVEVVLLGDATEALSASIEGNTLKLTPQSFYIETGVEYSLLIRYKHVYTEATILVEIKE